MSKKKKNEERVYEKELSEGLISSDSIEPPSLNADFVEDRKGRIDVNEDYEIEYGISKKIKGKQFVFGRKVRLILLRKDPKEPLVLRADNYHWKGDGSGKWPLHIHKPKSKSHHYFVGCDWRSLVEKFIEYALDEIGKEHEEDLKSAIEKLPIK